MQKSYREEFVAYCFKAVNDFSSMFFSGNELKFAKFKNSSSFQAM